MIQLDVDAKRTILTAIAEANRSVEAQGQSGSALHQTLRAIEERLGAHPDRSAIIVDSPIQPSEYDGALVSWLLQELSPRQRGNLYRLKDSSLFGGSAR